MKFISLTNAENVKSQALETASKSLMIVMMEGFYYVCSRKEAAKLEKQGYEVI